MDRQKIASTGQLALRTCSGASGKVVILLSETMLFHPVFRKNYQKGSPKVGKRARIYCERKKTHKKSRPSFEGPVILG